MHAIASFIVSFKVKEIITKKIRKDDKSWKCLKEACSIKKKKKYVIWERLGTKSH